MPWSWRRTLGWLVPLALASAMPSEGRGAEEPISMELGAPEPIILGDVEVLEVTFRAPETPQTEGRPLRVSVNVGSFSEVERLEAGVYRAKYQLPATRFPQVALVAVWRETGPEAGIAFLRIPLSARTSIPVRARAKAELTVLVGQQEFGPVQASASGKATVPIVVPPGVGEVLVQSKLGSKTTQATVSANVPPYNRLTLAVTPYLVEANGTAHVTAHAYYDTDREAPPMEQVQLTAKGGVVTPIGQEGNRYRFRYVPKRAAEGVQVSLEAKVRGDRVSSAGVGLSLGVPFPEKISPRLVGVSLTADGRSKLPLKVLVVDRLGLGVEKLSVSATIAQGRIEKISELGNGEYEILLEAPRSYPRSGATMLRLTVDRPRGEALVSSFPLPVLPPAWPTSAEMLASPSVPLASMAFLLLIRATNAAGDPAVGARLAATAAGGTLSMIEEVGNGEYRAEVLPDGSGDDIRVSLSDATGNLRQEVTIQLRQPPELFAIGAKVGVLYSARLMPSFGLELDLIPGWLERRLAFFLAATFHQRSQTADLGPTRLDATLRAVPLSLGARYDLYVAPEWALYSGLAATLITGAHSVETDLQEVPTRFNSAIGADLLAGFTTYGFFAELSGSYADLSDAGAIKTPRFGVSLMLGYRLGVF